MKICSEGRMKASLKLSRQKVALAFAFGCAILLSWALVRSYNETAELEATYPLLPEEFVHFRLTVFGIDEVNRIAEVKAEVISNWRETDDHIRLLRLRGMPPIVVTRMSAPGTNDTAILSIPLSQFPGQRKVTSFPPPTDRVGDDFTDNIFSAISIGNSSKVTLYFGPVALRMWLEVSTFRAWQRLRI